MQESFEPPFPSELLTDSPHVARMSAPELGALYSLATTYWRGQAIDLPRDEAALSVLARCHTRRWYDVRESVLAAWERLRPQLASVYAQTVNTTAARRVAYRANLAIANEAKDRKRQAQRAKAGLVDGSDSLAPLVPQRSESSTKTHANNGETIPKRTLRGQKHALLNDAN